MSLNSKFLIEQRKLRIIPELFFRSCVSSFILKKRKERRSVLYAFFMKQESKILCYQKAYNLLKKMDHITDLKYPEQKKNLEFSCQIGDIETIYNMRLRTDLLTIRGIKKYPGLTDSQLTEIAKEILENEEYMYTAYNEMIIYQLSLTIASMTDKEAIALVNEKTEKFVSFLDQIADFDESIQIVAKEAVLEEKVVEQVDEKQISEEESALEPVLTKKYIIKKETDSVEESIEEEGSTSAEDIINDTLFAGLEDKKDEEESDAMKESLEQDPEELLLEFSVSDEEKVSEKERILFQLEWIAEKKAENKRKETLLNEKLSAAEELEKKAISMMEEAKEKAAYWVGIKEQCEEKCKEITDKTAGLVEKESNLKQLEKNLANREEQNHKMLLSVEQNKKETEEQMKILLAKEKDITNEKRSMELISGQIREEQQELQKNKKDFLEQMSTYKNENQSLKDRCKVLQQEIKDKNANILELTEHNSKLKEEIESQEVQKWEERLQAQEAKISALDLEREKAVKALQVRLIENNEMMERLEVLESSSKKSSKKLVEKERLVEKLRKEIDLYKQEGTELGIPDEVLQDFAETRKINRQLKRELNDMKMEYESLEKAHLKEIEDLKKSLNVERDSFLKEKEESLPSNRAAFYQQDLISSGIKLNIEETNHEVCLHGNREGCDIFVNLNKNIIIVSKDIPRANRFTQKIQEWNESELTETYFCTKKSITCKKSLVDLTIDLNKLLQKFILLK